MYEKTYLSSSKTFYLLKITALFSFMEFLEMICLERITFQRLRASATLATIVTLKHSSCAAFPPLYRPTQTLFRMSRVIKVSHGVKLLFKESQSTVVVRFLGPLLQWSRLNASLFQAAFAISP